MRALQQSVLGLALLYFVLGYLLIAGCYATIGAMVPSHRAVVDQSYQVALNLVFPDKKTQDDYQLHPLHLQFVEGVFKRVCRKVVVYDFE